METTTKSRRKLIAGAESTEKITAYLRENNRGYTIFEGHGSVDAMQMIYIVLPRRETPKVLRDIRRVCEGKVFVVDRRSANTPAATAW